MAAVSPFDLIHKEEVKQGKSLGVDARQALLDGYVEGLRWARAVGVDGKDFMGAMQQASFLSRHPHHIPSKCLDCSRVIAGGAYCVACEGIHRAAKDHEENMRADFEPREDM